MSSGQAADDNGDLEPVTFIRMKAEDTFDGQERVMTQGRLRPAVPRHLAFGILRPPRVRA